MAGGSKKANGHSNGKAGGSSKTKAPSSKKKNSPKNKITNWLVSSASGGKKRSNGSSDAKESGASKDDVRVSPRRQLLKEEEEEGGGGKQEKEGASSSDAASSSEEEEEYPPGSRVSPRRKGLGPSTPPKAASKPNSKSPSKPKPNPKPNKPNLSKSTSEPTPSTTLALPPPRRAASIASSIAITSALTNGSAHNKQTKLENNTNHQGSTLSPAQVMLLDLLRRVRRKGDMYGFFAKPVDPLLDDCEDYHDEVPESEAMDLSTLEKLIRAGKCNDLNTFEKFIRKIVENAKAYNADPEHTVHIEAKVLEENAMPMIEAMRWKFNKRGAGGYEDEVSETQTSGSSQKVSKREKKRVSYDESDSRFWDSMGEKMSPNAKIRKKNAQIANPGSKINSGKINSPLVVPTSVREYKYTDRDSEIPGAAIPQCDRHLKNSQIDYCHDRSKWIGWVEDMVTVCNEAARRRTLITTSGRALRYDKPLSDDYIKERLELDDPLFGFTVRDKPSKEMQGFIVTTNFTVWRESFRFDTNIPQAGITQADRKEHLCDDGTLTDELSEVRRSGDKKGSGIVFERVAEIGLLGGLGCGAALVEKAISHLESTKKYDYLVLQATKMAIPFYERCGFIRIGAVAKFNDNPNMPYVSYRHWSDIVAGTAVEASYMMGMRLGEKKKENEQNMKKQAKQKQPTVKLTPKTEKRKELEKQVADREKALEIAKSLILQAIDTNVDEDGGGSAFKELVALAKQQASEGEDWPMERALDKAYTIFKSSVVETVMEAKDLLRESVGLDVVHALVPRTKNFNVMVRVDDEVKNLEPSLTDFTAGPNPDTPPTPPPNIMQDLDMEADHSTDPPAPAKPIFYPKANALTAQVPSNTMIFGMPPAETLRRPGIVHQRVEEWLGWQEGPFLRDMRVRVKAGGAELGARKEAESPRKGRNPHTAGGKHLNGYRLRFDTVDAMRRITKNTVLPRGRVVMVEDRVPINHAVAISLHSLLEKVELQSGNNIMYRFEGFHGWLEGVIERPCKKGEAPAGAVVEESFIVKFDDGRRLAVVLSDVGGNRGVGRTWCTFNEWASFSVLPLDILDACLLGQEAHFDSLVGGHSVGTVSDRIGGGLDGQIMWVVETDLTDKASRARTTDPKNVLTQHFTTAELKHFIRVDDLGTAQQRSVLDRQKYKDFELTSHQKIMFGVGEDEGEGEEEDRKARRKRLREESEDRIVVEVSTDFFLYGRERTNADRKRALQRFKEIESKGADVVMEGGASIEQGESDDNDDIEGEEEEEEEEGSEVEGMDIVEEKEDNHEVRPAKKAKVETVEKAKVTKVATPEKKSQKKRAATPEKRSHKKKEPEPAKKAATPEKRSHKKKEPESVKKVATPEKRSHKKKEPEPAKKAATPEKRSHKKKEPESVKKVATPEKRSHKKKEPESVKKSHKKKEPEPQVAVETRTQPNRNGKSNGSATVQKKKTVSGKRKR
ncbi:hypothetical protein TrST_g4199 [Triparma strigata]|uniref:Bromo domain-containing protein n=1 Tax=Triparma strigata TaxID=1606541 RepID=A0A9W7A8M6_9STRA|nr:hypothetical protein TrST_g4199 [Triparma strigata]